MIETRTVENLLRARTADAEDGRQRDISTLLVRHVNSSYTWHVLANVLLTDPDVLLARQASEHERLPLTLFVLGVLLVNDVYAALPTHNLIVGASFLDTCAYFHGVRYAMLIYGGTAAHCSQ